MLGCVCDTMSSVSRHEEELRRAAGPRERTDSWWRLAGCEARACASAEAVDSPG